MEELLNILSNCCPDIDFEGEQKLIDDGIIDSMDIVMLIGELSDAYEIEIGINDLTPSNFNSVETIYALIQRLQNED